MFLFNTSKQDTLDMNKSAWALLALGLVSTVGCKSSDTMTTDNDQNYEVADAATPVTFAITGMT